MASERGRTCTQKLSVKQHKEMAYLISEPMLRSGEEVGRWWHKTTTKHDYVTQVVASRTTKG